ncbi:unnamed protein product [Bubo scandiacus]
MLSRTAVDVHLGVAGVLVSFTIGCKLLGLLLTDLQCANKRVYAPRGQAIVIVQDLGAILFSWMIDCTRQLANIIINKVATMSEKFNRKNCRQYDAIVTEITSTAVSTFVLVEPQDYVDVLRSHSLG